MRLAAEVTSEEELTVGRMRENWMLLEQTLRTDSLLSRATESFDLGQLLLAILAFLGPVGPGVLVHAGAHLDVEQQRAGAGHLEGGSLIAAYELVADRRMVEEAVGAGATLVDALGRGLQDVSVAAVHVLREHAPFPVPRGIVEHEAVFAEDGRVFALLAQKVQIALLFRREFAELLGTDEVVVGPGEVEVVVDVIVLG